MIVRSDCYRLERQLPGGIRKWQCYRYKLANFIGVAVCNSILP